MFNPFRLYREYKRNRELRDDILNGVFFFEVPNRCMTKVDPMLAYVKLKEHGFDVFGEEYTGVLNANPMKTKAFLRAVCDAFDLTEYDGVKGTGITVLEALRLYLSFFKFLMTLKKNVFFLQEYLPSLEDRLTELSNFTRRSSNSQPPSSTSDSTSTSSTEPRQQDSPPSTEQAAPSTV